MHSTNIREYFTDNHSNLTKQEIISFIGQTNYNFIKDNNIYQKEGKK